MTDKSKMEYLVNAITDRNLIYVLVHSYWKRALRSSKESFIPCTDCVEPPIASFERFLFFSCNPNIFSSTLSLVIIRYTRTVLVWPIRWSLSIAWSCKFVLKGKINRKALLAMKRMKYMMGCWAYLYSRIPPRIDQYHRAGHCQIEPYTSRS